MGISGGKLTVVYICMCQSRQPGFPGAISTFKNVTPFSYVILSPDFCSESHNWVNEEGKAPVTGLGLVTQLREPSSEESWPQKALRGAPTASGASWVLPSSAALGPPGMAVSGQFSQGGKITLESGPLRGAFTRLHMTVMQVYL